MHTSSTRAQARQQVALRGRASWTPAVAAAVMSLAVLAVPAPASARPSERVRVTVDVTGAGVLRTADRRIHCPPRCVARYPRGHVLTVHARPARNFRFSFWSAGCVGWATSCSVLLDRDTTVRADLSRREGEPIVVTVGGPGRVVSEPSGILCGRALPALGCSSFFGLGHSVTLVATPDADGVFAGWGGACRAAPPSSCVLEVPFGSRSEVTAAFGHGTPASGPQTVTTVSPAARVWSLPTGIDCGVVCSAEFAPGTLVTLAGGVGSWDQDCIGAASACTVVADAPTRVLAVPPAARPASRVVGRIDVAVSGPGRVRSTGSIDCGFKPAWATCGFGYVRRGRELLRASPAARFVRWSGACKGRRPRCGLATTGRRTVRAIFHR
jgi:List-Bact-rpt repeat protein